MTAEYPLNVRVPPLTGSPSPDCSLTGPMDNPEPESGASPLPPPFPLSAHDETNRPAETASATAATLR
ncbi:hypothetical protein ACETU7_23290 [Rhodococcus sp. 3Y1]